jgi:phage tail sheath protein FI
MPEYLAPGVYVEEIDTGSKPIEGVSTSTAGMLGVTERGPVDVPILITSYGEYVRWFGERLNPTDFTDTNTGAHCYLPYAVEGFFTNGGKRVYVTRVLDLVASRRATFNLHDRGPARPAETVLFQPAQAGDGVAPAPPLMVLNVNAAGAGTSPLVSPLTVRIGDGSDAEYGDVAAVINAGHIRLSYPLSRDHASGVSARHIPHTPVALGAGNSVRLLGPAAAGDRSITVEAVGNVAVTIAALANDQIFEIGAPPDAEHRFVTNLTVLANPAHARFDLDSPLGQDWPANTPIVPLDSTAAPVAGGNKTLASAALLGDRTVFVNNPQTAFDIRADLVVIDSATPASREARRMGKMNLLALSTGAYARYPTDARLAGVTLGDDAAVGSKQTTAAVPVGTIALPLDNRVGLTRNAVIRVGNAPDDEFVTIRDLPDRSTGGAPPDRGNVLLAHPLNRAHPTGTTVQLQNAPAVAANRPNTVLDMDTVRGGRLLVVADGGDPAVANSSFADNEFVRVTSGTRVWYHRLEADAVVSDARPITLTLPLDRRHPRGAAVVQRTLLLDILALDRGGWGNRLRVSVEDEEPGLLDRTDLVQLGGPTQIRLSSASGVESGTVLELLQRGTDVRVGDLLKVREIHRATGEITLDPPLSAAQLAAITALPPGTRMQVRSREFRLTVHLLRQPDPLLPTRDETVLDTEVFRWLSMDPRHSRYVQTVVGTDWNETPGTSEDNALPARLRRPLRLEDHRSQGESRYIRAVDMEANLSTRETARLGPEELVDVLSDQRERPARHPLENGLDSIATLLDSHYIGQDDPNPENRTGLQSLKNIEEISIVACPGRTTVPIQNALINHCELMRYRFAVLDAQRPPNDAMADVQSQRQQFDTKYAALYHPWLSIPDPYPVTLSRIQDYAIPPSGHVVGIYARVDVERGVHKAPANEVVRGIVGLQRLLNKEQQDILNPYPVNINVIRDFRLHNRGIRVFGGRVITSDSDWKYVNVRRLLIFIEASIDRGLQWVVFEPNAEPLWARVRRSISNFLTLAWRNGALEGTKVEEAYFVKCDRTTMTQTDIDQGRLICVVGVAPVKPAEFVIIRIGLWTAHAED